MRPLIAWLLYLIVAVVTLRAAQWLVRRGVPAPLTRKLVHIMAGILPLVIVPLARERRAALLPYVVTVGGNLLLIRRGALDSLDRSRGDAGIVYLPLAQSALIAWGWPARWPATRAALVALALGDSGAALIGERWGRHRYRLAGAQRSVEGSAALAAVTTAAAWLSTGKGGAAIVAGLGAAAAEAISPHGTDNLTIPLAVALLLGHS